MSLLVYEFIGLILFDLSLCDYHNIQDAIDQGVFPHLTWAAIYSIILM